MPLVIKRFQGILHFVTPADKGEATIKIAVGVKGLKAVVRTAGGSYNCLQDYLP